MYSSKKANWYEKQLIKMILQEVVKKLQLVLGMKGKHTKARFKGVC